MANHQRNPTISIPCKLPEKVVIDRHGVYVREYDVTAWTGADWRMFYAFMRSRSAVLVRDFI